MDRAWTEAQRSAPVFHFWRRVKLMRGGGHLFVRKAPRHRLPRLDQRFNGDHVRRRRPARGQLHRLAALRASRTPTIGPQCAQWWRHMATRTKRHLRSASICYTSKNLPGRLFDDEFLTCPSPGGCHHADQIICPVGRRGDRPLLTPGAARLYEATACARSAVHRRQGDLATDFQNDGESITRNAGACLIWQDRHWWRRLSLRLHPLLGATSAEESLRMSPTAAVPGARQPSPIIIAPA